MRKSWRIVVAAALCSLYAQTGCVQTPTDKSVQGLRPIEGNISAKKQNLTAADITQQFARAEQLQRENKLKEAIALCEKMREPGSPHVLKATRKLASLHEAAGDSARAEQEYMRLLQQTPKDADLLTKIGDLHKSRGQFAAAEKWYRDALYHQTNHVAARAALGFALAHQGQCEQSVAEFRKIVSKAEALCEVAFVLKLQGKQADALRYYQAALAEDATLERARSEVAKMQTTARVDPVARPVVPPLNAGQSGSVQFVEPPITLVETGGRQMAPTPSLPPLPEINPPAPK